MPGSWPDGPRDVALFNFWGNNSGPVSVGSGLAFFNKTERAVLLATAWAEAMAFPANQQAPDDQVLNKLLNSPGGEWMFRTDLGYLPAAYLRHPPLIYCGVDPVIDHDHGNPPGLIAHSSSEPVLPPEVAADWSAADAPADATAVPPAEAPPAEVAPAPAAMKYAARQLARMSCITPTPHTNGSWQVQAHRRRGDQRVVRGCVHSMVLPSGLVRVRRGQARRARALTDSGSSALNTCAACSAA